ncbi:hypothetical protein Pcinc_007889 [Petrolisthes cinctipes]|uniref:Uncharacterized protein n=1 Tax=Petrolisthes cinctipes TaxID=88211 RepID=A0AAE1G7K6_PETCI|nr:hypothetical protein Pcinc_007889 [Petrolisthes cinctipes]
MPATPRHETNSPSVWKAKKRPSRCTQDSFIWINSDLRDRCAAGEFGDHCLLGDGGYSLEPFLMTPTLSPSLAVTCQCPTSYIDDEALFYKGASPVRSGSSTTDRQGPDEMWRETRDAKDHIDILKDCYYSSPAGERQQLGSCTRPCRLPWRRFPGSNQLVARIMSGGGAWLWGHIPWGLERVFCKSSAFSSHSS